jgi:hypothetical protein
MFHAMSEGLAELIANLLEAVLELLVARREKDPKPEDPPSD